MQEEDILRTPQYFESESVPIDVEKQRVKGHLEKPPAIPPWGLPPDTHSS
jgi:hypothetical protein